ncbi:short chain dehydrogenase/reductase family oxidoreductase, putative [Paecilomyces variotii No. 5]|uniref:Short chain dehydrogenase/reductase family oxidoreductase, putative n=1 Tax=Byssochlamys spectabilis (strain No. 5 / NBRC 109023) TaxID=1356009 RepID=V5HTN9_BYSSN|nr:short chain dehydrogenase/reductase family oxidoreductase, putative [Paecilomyces variotii No. 5]
MSEPLETQPRNLPLLATPETCAGRTYIVTGSNTGLGYEAAKHLVALGAARVIMAVRNVGAGETAKAEIERDTGKINVAEVWTLDLASYDSVKAFAKRAITDLDRIDALIENAAVGISQRMMAEGHLLPLTVNVFSTFLLAVLLLPKMRQTAKSFGILPHLTIVSSGVGFDFKAAWDKIKDDPVAKLDAEEVELMATYGLSKLMEIFAIRYFATLIPLSRSGVVLNTVSPGLCKTDLARNATPAFREQLQALHAQYGRTAEDGSRTLLHAAIAGKESHGCYLSSCEIAESKVPSWISDEEGKKSQKYVWELIATELESIEPGSVKKILES